MKQARAAFEADSYGDRVPVFVTGLFADARRAREAFERLVATHFDPHEISVLRVGDGPLEAIPVVHKSGVPAGLTAGVALGGTVGLVGGVAVAGPAGLLASGPVLAALQGTLAGVAGGGLLGALAGLAFWWDEPELEAELERGSVLIAVTAAGARARAARLALRAAGATRIFG